MSTFAPNNLNRTEQQCTVTDQRPKKGSQSAKVQSSFEDKLKQALGLEPKETGSTRSCIEQAVREASATYNVPQEVICAVIQQESAYNCNAVSPCGAEGLMQLMPGTAAELGVKDSFNPRENIMGGTKYLAQMLEMFDGDLKLALAAYNAGPGNVKNYDGIPPFAETQNYVKRITNNLEKNNVTIPQNVREASPVDGFNQTAEAMLADNSPVNGDILPAYDANGMLAMAALSEATFANAFVSNSINSSVTQDIVDAKRENKKETKSEPVLPRYAIPV